jgi:hypothetical protein
MGHVNKIFMSCYYNENSNERSASLNPSTTAEIERFKNMHTVVLVLLWVEVQRVRREDKDR